MNTHKGREGEEREWGERLAPIAALCSNRTSITWGCQGLLGAVIVLIINSNSSKESW